MRSSLCKARQEKFLGPAICCFMPAAAKDCAFTCVFHAVSLYHQCVSLWLRYVDFYDLTDLFRPGEWSTWCKPCSDCLVYCALSGYPAFILWPWIFSNWISHTHFQGCTDLQRLVTCLDHGDIVAQCAVMIALKCAMHWNASRQWPSSFHVMTTDIQPTCCDNADQTNKHSRQSSSRGVMIGYDSHRQHTRRCSSVRTKVHFQNRLLRLPEINLQASQTPALYVRTASALCAKGAKGT